MLAANFRTDFLNGGVSLEKEKETIPQFAAWQLAG